MVAMEDGGAGWRVRRIIGSAHFKGYAVLDAGRRTAGEYHASTLAAVGNIHDALTRNAELASSGETALAAQRLCEQIGSRALALAASGIEPDDFDASTAASTLSGAVLRTRSPAMLPTLTEVHAAKTSPGPLAQAA
jgi:hypothetical protein